MSLFSMDTRPEVVGVLLEGYRRMTPAQKLARVADLTAAARQMAAARIRSQYPEADEAEVRMRLGTLVLGRETMRRVYSWDPPEEPR